MKRFYGFFLAVLLTWAPTLSGPIAAATRLSAMLTAKNLVVTTTDGTTYYYLVTSNDYQRLQLADGNVTIGDDVFAITDIQSLQLRSLPKVLLNEDSTTFNKKFAVNHGLLALRRTMATGKWNSLILPVSLTTEQIIDAFGEGTQVAKPRGTSEEDATVIELTTLEMEPGEVVMTANYPYLIKPTREPDVASDKYLYNFESTRLLGPFYLIPNISSTSSIITRILSVKSEDESTFLRFRGTYLKLDDSVVSGTKITNARIAAGTYMLNDEGCMQMNEEDTEVSAFAAWLEDLSTEKRPLTFYVDGESLSPDGIADLQQQPATTPTDNGIYDISGRRVGSMPDDRLRLKPGLYIIQGRKVKIQ